MGRDRRPNVVILKCFFFFVSEKVVRQGRWERSEVARWERWENDEAERWELPGFI